MRAIAALVLFALVAAVSAQSLCAKYATALSLTQATLLETVVNDTVNAVVSDSVTKPWFDGTNNTPGKNFLTNPTALTTLFNHLVGFFGSALQCNSAEFTGTGKYTIGVLGVNTNMTAVHGSFQQPVNKAAYEAFNIHLLDVLRGYGVTNDDLKAVAQILDTFRGPTLHPTVPDNQVCQASDCNTPPFTVHATDSTANYFSPSYLTIPVGGTVTIKNTGSRSHTMTQGTAVVGGACTKGNNGFDSGTLAVGNTFTTPAQNTAGAVTFFCSFHCPTFPATTQMVGTLNVVAASTTTSTASTLAFAVAAIFVAIIAALF